MNKVLTAAQVLQKHIQEFKNPVELAAIYDEDYAGGKYLCINESVALAAMEAYKNQSSVSHVVKDVLDTLGYYDGNYAVGESNIKDACKELVRLLTVPQPELPQFSVSDEEDLVAKAKLLAVEAWRMLPDTCKKIMGESLKKTFTESLTEDIIYQFKK